MNRYLPFFLLFAPVAFAAPVPKFDPEKHFKENFGEFNDPTKKHSYEIDREKLTIKLSETPRGKSFFPLDHPHTKRKVTGDFEISVIASYPLPAKCPKEHSCAGVAGLLIWQDKSTNVLFQRQHQPCGLFDGTNRWDGNFCIEFKRPTTGTEPDQMSAHVQNSFADAKETKVHLKLVKEKGMVSTFHSFDGKTWKAQRAAPMKFEATLQVGVFAYQTLGAPIDVTFETFSVVPLPRK